MRRLDTTMHFLLGLKRMEFTAIGGYDEDLTGSHYDDNDFVERLQKNGCHYVMTDARIIHLFHPRPRSHALRRINRRVYWDKKDGPIVRNANREWGVAYA